MTEKSLGELYQVKEDIHAYGQFALSMLSDSLHALDMFSTNKAEEVIARRKDLRDTYVSLEDSMFQYLALYHPVARDMRSLVASIRIIYNLERIGKMGCNIAEIVINLSGEDSHANPEGIIRMGSFVMKMISDTLIAYDESSMVKISDMKERDSFVDQTYSDLLIEYIKRMEREKEHVPSLTRYVIIDRLLERCGDQACNMSEMIIYMISGERIEIL